MLSKEIRKKFLKYFESHSHTIVPSSPVLPHDDPTLLFTNAGMNQFKDIFLGKSKREYNKATSSQKCIRVGGKHNDLENVGHTSRHLTFFEMLGNFSFGDYFKKEAIGFAWDVATHIFDLDPDKIWVSVYEKDDEAFALWEKYLPSSKIVKFGEKENFWSMGETGPCGPCTELLYDRGEKYSDASSPIYDTSGERFLEFWNLVFMQFNKTEKGLSPLPKPCVDTGAGLERILSLKIDVDSVFLTDLFQKIILETEKLTKIKYDIENKELSSAFNVIADHIRMLSFSIADGVIPSNIDRGYVLRKILRRAVRYGKRLNLKKPFLAKLLPPLIETMGEEYPNLISSKDQIEEILTLEEENFIKTLDKGGSLLNNIIKYSKKKISGADAFKLKDTYGFPIEEILLIAKDALLDVDLKTFYQLEEEAKERSKKAQIKKHEFFDKNIFSDFTKIHSPSQFLGYEKDKTESKIIAMLKENKFVDEIEEKDKAILILDKTPFYAEMGGQVGDTGKIYIDENIFEVTSTISPYTDVIAHIGYVKKGNFLKNKKVYAEIDSERRRKIENNHSATHLLHYALSQILKGPINQSGSFVDSKHLRLDFTYHKALTTEEIREVEKIVNGSIRKNFIVKTYNIPFSEAEKDKKIKQLFFEKYSNIVRVVDMEISKELCGGCHTSQLGNIGLFKIANETSISKGNRRIEAYTGERAEKYTYEKEDLLFYLQEILKTSEAKLVERINSILSLNKTLSTDLKRLKEEKLKFLKQNLLNKKEKIDSIYLIAEEIDLPSKELIPFIKKLSLNLTSTVIALAIKEEKYCQIAIKVTEDLLDKKILADKLATDIAPIIEGKGGGKMEIAQIGGKGKTKINEAFNKLRDIIKSKC
ncbi:MAG: alanyl-tRNA synthetase [Chlamydiae bacterium SM23_39]|nr:MAG: alanyl-tRNA synthetase [Chlamydiae bacterium SM23_39]